MEIGGVDINSLNSHFETIAFCILSKPNLNEKAVEYLISKSIDLSLKNYLDETAFHYVCRINLPITLRYMIENNLVALEEKDANGNSTNPIRL